MCDTAMHLEALRKKRLLERKAMAQQRMAQFKVDDTQNSGMHRNEATRAPQYDQSASWNDIERQLRHEAKVLRDHNLYMGHTSAFKDLYKRGMLDPSN